MWRPHPLNFKAQNKRLTNDVFSRDAFPSLFFLLQHFCIRNATAKEWLFV